MFQILELKKAFGHFRNLIDGPSPEPLLKNPVYEEVYSHDLLAYQERDKVLEILRGWEMEGVVLEKGEALYQLMETLPHPHIPNEALNKYEETNGIDQVRCYPTKLHMDLSTLCDIQCRFCKVTKGALPTTFHDLDLIKSIEWFPYISHFNFSAGTAESVINPQFLDIFDYVDKSFPYMTTALLSNGRGLKKKILDRLLGSIDTLYVSMNASSEEDYERMVHRGSWETFSENMKVLGRLAKERTGTHISTSFVTSRVNIDSSVRNLEFAVEHGAERVWFYHFAPNYLQSLHGGNEEIMKQKFGPEESLYFDKDHSDEVFHQVTERAKELGVIAHTPPPFSDPNIKIFHGNRWPEILPDHCGHPWTELWLHWSYMTRKTDIRLCCGINQGDQGVEFDWADVATKKGLLELRNHPVIRAYRRTVNGDNMNPNCEACRQKDRFDPKANMPHPREFYIYNDLPVPEHYRENSD